MAKFLEKWTAKKASKPKAGTKNAVDTFKTRVAEQKGYLEDYERDTAGFKKWRSTWFQKVPGGFGVTVGRDSVDAGKGLSYVVVASTKEIAEFLDDLAAHADNDVGFQQALEENRLKRVARLGSAKADVTAKKSAPTSRTNTAAAGNRESKTASKASKAKSSTAVADAEKPRRGRKPKASV